MRPIVDTGRLLDLVTNQRVSLHQQGLISDDEFIALSAEAKDAMLRVAADTKEIGKKY